MDLFFFIFWGFVDFVLFHFYLVSKISVTARLYISFSQVPLKKLYLQVYITAIEILIKDGIHGADRDVLVVLLQGETEVPRENSPVQPSDQRPHTILHAMIRNWDEVLTTEPAGSSTTQMFFFSPSNFFTI